MEKDPHKLFKGFVVILLIFNTFFLAGIWYNMSSMMGPGAKSSWCPWSGKAMPK